MAQNILPENFGSLVVLAGKCSAGLTSYGAALGITQLTAAGLDADADALSAAMNGFSAARAARPAASATLNSASAAAKKFLSDGRGVLVAHWGEKYSQQWAAAGWTDNRVSTMRTAPLFYGAYGGPVVARLPVFGCLPFSQYFLDCRLGNRV